MCIQVSIFVYRFLFSGAKPSVSHVIPIIRSLKHYSWWTLWADFCAGIIVGCVHIPQCTGTSIDHLINHSINWSIRQRIDQLFNHALNQELTKQSIENISVRYWRLEKKPRKLYFQHFSNGYWNGRQFISNLRHLHDVLSWSHIRFFRLVFSTNSVGAFAPSAALSGVNVAR